MTLVFHIYYQLNRHGSLCSVLLCLSHAVSCSWRSETHIKQIHYRHREWNEWGGSRVIHDLCPDWPHRALVTWGSCASCNENMIGHQKESFVTFANTACNSALCTQANMNNHIQTGRWACVSMKVDGCTSSVIEANVQCNANSNNINSKAPPPLFLSLALSLFRASSLVRLTLPVCTMDWIKEEYVTETIWRSQSLL